MAQVFELCQNNFYRSLRIAQKALKSPDVTTDEIEQISQALTDATQQLNKMEIQYSLNRDMEMKNKIGLFKDQLKNYKKQLHKKQQVLKEKQQQTNSGPLFQMQSHQKGVDPLIQAKRQMYQNQAMSNQAALGLRNNNQKLSKNINRMGDINNQLTVAQKLLGSIKKKLRKNKMVLWGTIGILILVVIFVIYTYMG